MKDLFEWIIRYEEHNEDKNLVSRIVVQGRFKASYQNWRKSQCEIWLDGEPLKYRPNYTHLNSTPTLNPNPALQESVLVLSETRLKPSVKAKEEFEMIGNQIGNSSWKYMPFNKKLKISSYFFCFFSYGQNTIKAKRVLI